MGLRFRKSIKIAPGIRLNIGKKSAGISFGGKGVRYSVNTSGRRTASVGIPGSGLYYTKTTNAKRTRPPQNNLKKEEQNMKKTQKCKNCGEIIPVKAKRCPSCGAKNRRPLWKRWWFWLLVVLVFGFGSSSEDKPEEVQPVQESVNVDAEKETLSEEIEETTEDHTVLIPTVIVEEEQIQPNISTEEENAVIVPTEEPVESNQFANSPEIEAPVTEESVTETPTTQEQLPPVSMPTEEVIAEEHVITEPVGQIVYITDTGKRYHRGNCRHLAESRIETTLDSALSMGLTPCGTCKP